MNIEELSKAQLILLTILINFITSVATGILTVSLLDQAPAVVTQTINRVVDHTIEKVTEVVPAVGKPSSPAPSNQDLVTAAIAADAARTVAIFDLKTGTSSPAVALGTYLPSARAVVTATRETLPKEALIEFANKAHVAASLSHAGSGLTIFGFSDTAALPKASVPLLLAAKDLKLGQTVLAIGTDGSAATGIVARVSDTGVRTTLPDIGLGSAAVDLSGNLIGIATSGTTPGLLISADTITRLLTASSTPK
jgi:hypothetical protein